MVLLNTALVETIEQHQLEITLTKFDFDHLSMRKFTISGSKQSHNISTVLSGILP